ncbi:MAG TPA: gamma-glutamyltransferase, partial [Candidatus Eremiobacteraceae bacterium]
TLIANMLLREGRPRVVYGSMGGDAQPQTGLSLSIRIGERGMEPQAAIERPRWRWSSGTDPALLIERRAGSACVEGLRARGHSVGVTGDWDEALGHAGAIVIDRDRGIILAGTDPRSDGLALAR